jgi:hypothetical protein
MYTPSQNDNDLLVRWEKYTAREKSVVIAAFLRECGEHATWEQWLKFLHKHHQVKAFEWTLSVD